jgi:hypothetical protein
MDGNKLYSAVYLQLTIREFGLYGPLLSFL